LLALSALAEVCEKLELSTEQCEILEKHLGVLCKKERRRSRYQAFLSECMTGKVKKFGEAKEVLKACANQYRELKAEGKI